jgi:hypothetical protein
MLDFDKEYMESLRAEFIQGVMQDMQDACLGQGFPPVTIEEAHQVLDKVDEEEKKFQRIISFIGEVIFREPGKKKIIINDSDLRILQMIAQKVQSTVVYTGKKSKNGRTLDGVPIVIDDSAEKPRLE